MMIRMNCRYYGGYCTCDHPKMKKVLWIFKRECVDMRLTGGGNCSLREKFPKPKIGPLPPKKK